MKITIEFEEIIITVDEDGNVQSGDTQITMRWENQNKYVQETIKVICSEIKKLKDNIPKQK